MEIKAKRGDLLATLYWTQSIVERRNTMPILGNVLIEAKKNAIHLTATDLEVGVRGQVEGEVTKEGTVTVNAKKLYEIIREVSHDQVQLKRLENEWVEIRSGKSLFKIVGMDAKEFPQFPAFDGKGLSTTPASTIREMIERTIFAVSTDETRYSLNGVYIEQTDGGKARMVATDGHHITLGEWRRAKGHASIKCGRKGTHVTLQLTGLIPNGVYTVWVGTFQAPGLTPDFANLIGLGALGAPDGSQNVIVASPNGTAALSVFHPPGNLSMFGSSECLSEEFEVLLWLPLHLDGQTHGGVPGDECELGFQGGFRFRQ